MDKIWLHILKLNQSLPGLASIPVVLKIFRSSAIFYGNAELMRHVSLNFK